MALPLEDYAMIGNCLSAALVGRNGSIDWLCWPRFDSPACFAALLGKPDNGQWSIAPQAHVQAVRRYVEGTLVLETTFEGPGGSCRLTDGILVGSHGPMLVRHLEGLEGELAMQLKLIIRFDYGSVIPWVRRLDENATRLHAVAGPDALIVASPIPLHGEDLHSEAEFSIKSGKNLTFIMAWHRASEPMPALPENPYNALRKTIYWWKEWADRSQFQGEGKSEVDRSLLTLKALTYEPTGGIVAAPTTSLPENLGGKRNWDYRYCWLRDSTFTLYSLLTSGYREEAESWRRWLLRAIAGTPTQIKIMYGLAGERRLPEMELDWLDGYEASKPVRIGNDAHRQLQIDVFGEVMDTLNLAMRQGLPIDQDSWSIQKKLIDCVSTAWLEPDEGIWEIRGKRRHFTHSKVMAWVAVDRAIKASQRFALQGPVDEWVTLRKNIRQDILTHGYNEKLGSFVQTYGDHEVDASLLMMGLVGFLKPDDPRLLGTIRQVEKDLLRDGLVRRYRPHERLDGIGEEEGTFIACSFWLVDSYILLGRHAEARELFQSLLQLRNDVGLFAEEYCPKDKRLIGNFPQAFSHIAHVNSATNLFEKHGSAGDRSDMGIQD